ncbi:MAG: hypothetical protein ACRD36_08820, partial [Candidatus Acidiferrum sp.]
MTTTGLATAKTRNWHEQALLISSELTRWFRKDREPHVLPVSPENVINTLREAGVSFVLMGTYGINGYREEPRATQDVDVLVVKRDVRKAIRVLQERYPELDVIENIVVARFYDKSTQKVVIDVMKPSSDVMRIVFRNTYLVNKKYKIP